MYQRKYINGSLSCSALKQYLFIKLFRQFFINGWLYHKTTDKQEGTQRWTDKAFQTEVNIYAVYFKSRSKG